MPQDSYKNSSYEQMTIHVLLSLYDAVVSHILCVVQISIRNISYLALAFLYL